MQKISLEEIKAAILMLSERDFTDLKNWLADRDWELLNSIEGSVDSEVEKAVLDEAEKRWHEIESGSVECIPAEQAMKKLRDRLNT